MDFSHGIATLVATSAVVLSDDDIKKLLTEEFNALMKEEKEK